MKQATTPVTKEVQRGIIPQADGQTMSNTCSRPARCGGRCGIGSKMTESPWS